MAEVNGRCILCGRPLVKSESVSLPNKRGDGFSYICRKCFPENSLIKFWAEQELLEELQDKQFYDFHRQLRKAREVVRMAKEADLEELEELEKDLFRLWNLVVSKKREIEEARNSDRDR